MEEGKANLVLKSPLSILFNSDENLKLCVLQNHCVGNELGTHMFVSVSENVPILAPFTEDIISVCASVF